MRLSQMLSTPREFSSLVILLQFVARKKTYHAIELCSPAFLFFTGGRHVKYLTSWCQAFIVDNHNWTAAAPRLFVPEQR